MGRMKQLQPAFGNRPELLVSKRPRPQAPQAAAATGGPSYWNCTRKSPSSSPGLVSIRTLGLGILTLGVILVSPNQMMAQMLRDPQVPPTRRSETEGSAEGSDALQADNPPSAVPTVQAAPTALYYLPDENGKLVPVPGFTLADFDRFVLKDLQPKAANTGPQVVVDRTTVQGDVIDGRAVLRLTIQLQTFHPGWVQVPLQMSEAILTQAHGQGPGTYLFEYSPSGYTCWIRTPPGNQTSTQKPDPALDQSKPNSSASLQSPTADSQQRESAPAEAEQIPQQQNSADPRQSGSRQSGSRQSGQKQSRGEIPSVGESDGGRRLPSGLVQERSAKTTRAAGVFRHQLDLRLLVPLVRSGQLSSLQLWLPPAVDTQTELTVPVATARLRSNRPTVARPAELIKLIPQQQGTRTTLVIRGLDAAGRLRVEWGPGVPQRQETVARVEGEILVSIEGPTLRSQATLSLTGGEALEQLQLRLPPETRLEGNLTATDANGELPSSVMIRPDRSGVTTVGAESGQILQITFHRPARGRVQLRCETLRVLGDRRELSHRSGVFTQRPSFDQELFLGGFEVLNAVHQTGYIAVQLDPVWQLQWRRQWGVERVETADLPLPLSAGEVNAAFEYLTQPAVLSARLRRREPMVSVRPHYTFTVWPDAVELAVKLSYTVRSLGIRQVEVRLPDGWEVIPGTLTTEPPGLIDRLAVGEEQQLLQIPLQSQRSEAFELQLRARRPRHSPRGLLQLSLPAPGVDRLGPAVVVVQPANNVRISPLPAQMIGLVGDAQTIPRDPATQSALRPNLGGAPQQGRLWLQDPFIYQTSVATARFVAMTEVRPREVRLQVHNSVQVRPQEAIVTQYFRYQIFNEPLRDLTLQLPGRLLADRILASPPEVRLGDRLVSFPLISLTSPPDAPLQAGEDQRGTQGPSRENSPRPASLKTPPEPARLSGSPEPAVQLVHLTLPESQLGAFTLQLKYAIDRSLVRPADSLPETADSQFGLSQPSQIQPGTVGESIPLFMPADAVPELSELVLSCSPGLAVRISEGNWQLGTPQTPRFSEKGSQVNSSVGPDANGASLAGLISSANAGEQRFSARGLQPSVDLRVEVRSSKLPTSISRAWLQTRLLGQARWDRLSLVLEQPRPGFRLALPPGTDPKSVRAWLNQQPVAVNTTPDQGCLRVSIIPNATQVPSTRAGVPREDLQAPSKNQGRPRPALPNQSPLRQLVELTYAVGPLTSSADRSGEVSTGDFAQVKSSAAEETGRSGNWFPWGLAWSQPLAPPKLIPELPVSRWYWEVILPQEEYLLKTPSGLNPEFSWSLTPWGLSRDPRLEVSELEEWVGVQPVPRQNRLPIWCNRYVMSRDAPLSPIQIWTITRPVLVLGSSLLSLAIGLGLIYCRPLRSAGALMVLAVVLGALGLILPEVAVLAGQAALVGLALTGLAGLLRWALLRRDQRGRVIRTKPSSSASLVLGRSFAEPDSAGTTATAQPSPVGGKLSLP